MATANVGDVELYYEEHGSGDPLLLVMGLAADSQAWMFQVPELSKHFRTVVFDNRGVGRSSKPAGPYTTAAMADDAVGILDALGIETLRPAAAGCCGAIRHHLNDHDGGLADARRNIDAWWPYVAHAEEDGLAAILMNASGCGVQVKEYGHLLARDAKYAGKARRISEMTKDASEFLPAFVAELQTSLTPAAGNRVVFHPPCTLQHGQQIRGDVEGLLASLGAVVAPFAEVQMCCGSAGTYSVLQPELAYPLRDRKLRHLEAAAPDVILSANIGCITHLASGSTTRVMHWIEWIDERLQTT